MWARAGEGEPGLLLGAPLLSLSGWVVPNVLSGPQWGLLASVGVVCKVLCWSLAGLMSRVWSGAGGVLGVSVVLYRMARCTRVVWGCLIVVPGVLVDVREGEPGLPLLGAPLLSPLGWVVLSALSRPRVGAI